LIAEPNPFRDALREFIIHVEHKAVGRAKEFHRPLDPWNHYEPEFIRARLIEEIGEFLSEYTRFDNEDVNGSKEWADENSELFDIVALACSLWKCHNRLDGVKKE
jgi:NTP pyrophosphatase (non-canonical NTP hydrolase)